MRGAVKVAHCFSLVGAQLLDSDRGTGRKSGPFLFQRQHGVANGAQIDGQFPVHCYPSNLIGPICLFRIPKQLGAC